MVKDEQQGPIAEGDREEAESPVQRRENQLLERLDREREQKISTLVRDMVLTTIDEVQRGLD